MRVAVTGFRGVPATYGGIEHVCEQLYSRLAARGYQIKIHARSHYVKGDIRFYKGMQIKRLPSVDLKGLEAFVHTFLSVIYILIDNPHIVHIHAQGPCLFAWLPRLFRPKMKVFFTCHGLDWQRKKWSRAAALIIYMGEISSVLFPHYRIVVSKELQRYYDRRYGCPTLYIPNGVQKAEPKAVDLIKHYGLCQRGYFLFVGRIVPEKRVGDIICAYRQKVRQSKLVIVGDVAGSREYVKKLKQKTQGTDDIIFAGFQYGAALSEFFSNARAFITASELEGLPLTLLEALSYGLPCIASEIPPHREILRHTAAFFFQPGDVERLAHWMTHVEKMDDRELNQMGRTAIEMTEAHFGWEKSAAKLAAAYEESLA